MFITFLEKVHMSHQYPFSHLSSFKRSHFLHSKSIHYIGSVFDTVFDAAA